MVVVSFATVFAYDMIKAETEKQRIEAEKKAFIAELDEQLEAEMAHLDSFTVDIVIDDISHVWGEVDSDSEGGQSVLSLVLRVTNAGDGTAYIAGLRVTAQDADGNLIVNATVGLRTGAASAFENQYSDTDNMEEIGLIDDGVVHRTTVNLAPGQTELTNVRIYHSGADVVANYSVEPVYSKSLDYWYVDRENNGIEIYRTRLLQERESEGW